jgi:hypothetical protein
MNDKANFHRKVELIKLEWVKMMNKRVKAFFELVKYKFL